MFWGCFSGLMGKGPHLFWEKGWGAINSETYCQHTLPLVRGWMQLHPDHLFMHDNARLHTAAATIGEMKELGIRAIAWPPFSPDLNPIEAV